MGIPYYIDAGGVTINTGASLTIKPGVEVKFRKTPPGNYTAWLRVLETGSLVANGTAGQPIYITSMLDDAIGGDTNGDGAATTPAVGDWSGIRLASGAIEAFSNAVL